MTTFSDAIKGLRHGEERPGEAGTRLEPRTAPMQRNSCPATSFNPSCSLARFDTNFLFFCNILNECDLTELIRNPLLSPVSWTQL
jgi:hypothetical protein